MSEFITDEDLASAVGLEMKEFHMIVDWLRLKKHNITGCVKVSSHHHRKVIWAWNAAVVESVSREIMDNIHQCRLMRSCGHKR